MKGRWNDERGRAAACRKGAAGRKSRPRGPYGEQPLPEDVRERMRAIAARVQAAVPLPDPSERLATPGEVAARIDAVLEAGNGAGAAVPRETSRETSENDHEVQTAVV